MLVVFFIVLLLAFCILAVPIAGLLWSHFKHKGVQQEETVRFVFPKELLEYDIDKRPENGERDLVCAMASKGRGAVRGSSVEMKRIDLSKIFDKALDVSVLP